MERESRHHGLVVRAVAERRLRNLGWMVSQIPAVSYTQGTDCHIRLATDHLHPEWDVWGQFVVRRLSKGMEIRRADFGS
jgi:hypothetical protein